MASSNRKMEHPRTPQKQDGVHKLLMDLNLRWDLNLPVNETLQSPSTSASPGKSVGQLIGRIKWLYYQDRQGLDQAVESFEEIGKQIFSSWKFKPASEIDKVPRKPGDETLLPRHVLAAGATLTEDQRSVLSGALRKFLDMAYKAGKGRDGQVVPTVLAPQQVPQQSRPDDTAHKLGTLVRKSPTKTVQTKLLSYYQRRPSSGEDALSEKFGSDSIYDDLLLTGPSTIEMDFVLDRPHTPTNVAIDVSQAEDCFTTPPQMSASPRAFGMETDPVPVYKAQGSVSASRKRSSLNSNEELGSRKVSRSTTSKQQSTILDVRQWQPQHSSETFTSLQIPLLAALGPKRDSSFSSTATSIDSMDGSWQGRESGANTANTSFATHEDPVPPKAPRRKKKPLGRAATSAMMLADDPPQSHTIASADMERSTSDPGSSQVDDIKAGIANKVNAYMTEHLTSRSPFPSFMASMASQFLPHVRYEVIRLSLANRQLQEALFQALLRENVTGGDNYPLIWKILCAEFRKTGKEPPPKSSLYAWEKAQENSPQVRQSGDFRISRTKGDPFLSLQLRPLAFDASNRLTRHWGSRNLLYIHMPAIIGGGNLPALLRQDAQQTQSYFTDWILKPYDFLGLLWQMFYVKPVEKPKDRRKDASGERGPLYRLYFFGYDPCGQIGQFQTFLDWMLCPQLNLHESALKLYARIQLALSATTSTVEFQPWQIVRTRDAFSDCPRFRDIHGSKMSGRSDSKVMNDGCALISRKAAEQVAKCLRLPSVPSAFQGRIGGAKGMWMVDSSDQKLTSQYNPVTSNSLDPEVWIEVTDSQSKFVTKVHLYSQDASMRIFEVNSYSKPLESGFLNYQLITILMEGGVTLEILKEFLTRQITYESQRFQAAMRDKYKLLAFLPSMYSMTAQRGEFGTIKWLGAMPDSLPDRMSLLAQAGFEPTENAFFMESCWAVVRDLREAFAERGNIPVGRSAKVLILADPLNILEPGECHICFSTTFSDEQSGFSSTILHNLDVLVTRSPALVPSDVQKVRAIFKPELEQYKDVLIFSSKGARPLADLLSGGDYDGDRVTLIWDPDIVNPFQNSELLYQPPTQNFFGIRKDPTKVKDLYDSLDWPSNLLRIGLNFNMQKAMVGTVTNYHLGLAYKIYIEGDANPLSNPAVLKIAALAGYLVDAPKNGYIFRDKEWREYKQREKLPIFVPPPAYKRSDVNPKGPWIHPVDRLVFDVGLRVLEEELTDFNTNFKDESRSFDSDLTQPWNAEEKFASQHEPALKHVLVSLKTQIDTLVSKWRTRSSRGKCDQEDNNFRSLVSELREDFLAIQPQEGCGGISAKRWELEQKDVRLSSQGSWNRLKASCLFSRTYDSSPKMPYWVCGLELAHIKASKDPGARMVISSMYDILKVDKNAVKRRDEPESESFADFGDADENEIDEMGTQLFSDALEHQVPDSGIAKG